MHCVLYARVSTDRQVDRELSLPAQLAAMRAYASHQGWLIVQEFVEQGVSGRSTERPALQELLSRCRKTPHIDVVLVHKLDRLTRNVYDHAAMRAFFRRHQVQIASATEQMDESISGVLVENIMAAIAEFYSANLGQETKKGMQMSVERGGWPHRAPRGTETDSDPTAARSSKSNRRRQPPSGGSLNCSGQGRSRIVAS